MFYKKGVLKNFAKFTRKHLCLSLLQAEAYSFIKKETLAQVFSCEFYKIFKNTFLAEHLRMNAPVITYCCSLCSTSNLYIFFMRGLLSVRDAVQTKKKKKTSMTSYFMTCWTFLLLFFSFYNVVSLFLYIHSLFQHRCDYFQILNIVLTKSTIHRLSVIPITSNVIGVRRTRRLKLKP